MSVISSASSFEILSILVVCATYKMTVFTARGRDQSRKDSFDFISSFPFMFVSQFVSDVRVA